MFAPIILLALVAPTWSHFVLQSPASLGFDDAKEAQGPCGGMDMNMRPTGNITMWPVNGQPVSLLTTHPEQTWVFRYVLLGGGMMSTMPGMNMKRRDMSGMPGMDMSGSGMSGMDPNMKGMFMDMQANISQTGLGNSCYMVTAPSSLAGQDGVVQISQVSKGEEVLYQCAPVTFTKKSAATVGSMCMNDTAVKAQMLPVDVGSSLNSASTTGNMTGMNGSMPKMADGIRHLDSAGYCMWLASLALVAILYS